MLIKTSFMHNMKSGQARVMLPGVFGEFEMVYIFFCYFFLFKKLPLAKIWGAAGQKTSRKMFKTVQTEIAVRICSSKEVFFKISQCSQENTYAGISFFKKVADKKGFLGSLYLRSILYVYNISAHSLMSPLQFYLTLISFPDYCTKK